MYSEPTAGDLRRYPRAASGSGHVRRIQPLAAAMWAARCRRTPSACQVVPAAGGEPSINRAALRQVRVTDSLNVFTPDPPQTRAKWRSRDVR